MGKWASQPGTYAGFAIMDTSSTLTMDVNENTDLGTGDYAEATDFQKAAAVKVVRTTAVDVPDTGMYKVSIICRLSRFDELKKELNDLGVTGMTMTQVMGCGVQKGSGKPSQPFVWKAFVFCPIYDRILGKANRPAKRLCGKM